MNSNLVNLPDLRKNLLELLLRPLVRFCLRHAQSYQEFILVAKKVFVQMAEEELQSSSAKVNVSRISVLTGIYRPDIKTILEEGEMPSHEHSRRILDRVVNVWENDKRFTTKAGKPRVLSLSGEDNEFRELCATVSQAINPGTVLFEFVRTRVAEKTPNGLRLSKGEMRLFSNPQEGFEVLSDDLNTLILSVEQNLLNPAQPTNLHIRTEYDNIYVEQIPKIRRWLLEQGKAFHKRARVFLSKLDQDLAPTKQKKQPAGARVALTSASFTWPSTVRPPEVERTDSDS